MKNLFRMSLALVVILLRASTTLASAESVNHLLISEVQTATSASASQEFIELYNPTDSAISLTGWTVDYKSAAAVDAPSSWVSHATLAGSIRSHGYYLVAPKSYLSLADADWTATLAASGGAIRIRSANGMVVDQLGYGMSSVGGEGGAPSVAPAAGQSVERLPGRLQELAGNGTDTDDNAIDFIVRSSPLPQTSTSAIENPTDVSIVDVDPDSDTTSDTDVSPVVENAALQITELLVDPVSPLTDADDEYIEIYNPTTSDVDLAGYTLRTGANFHSYYQLPGGILKAGEYRAFYSRDTGLALTNSGGAAELTGLDGEVIDITDSYDAALAGQAWALFPDGWRWTLQTTPGSANVLAALPVAATTSTTPKIKKTTTKTAVKKATPKKAAAKKIKTAKAKAATPTPTLVAGAHTFQPSSRLLIGLALLTIGYALYEFRYDIQNYYRFFRRYPVARGDSRTPSKGRGDD